MKPCPQLKYWQRPDYKLNKKLKDAERYKANRCTLISQAAAWDKANKGNCRTRKKKWKYKNAAKIAAQRAIYYARNKNLITAYRKANMHIWQLASHRRRIKEKTCSSKQMDRVKKWILNAKNTSGVCCYWCRNKLAKSERTVDHIIALAVGGEHDVHNLCIACMPCNLRKGIKSIQEWNSAIAEPVLL